MNIRASEEREENKKHIKEFERNGFKVLEIDTNKISYRGEPWKSLTDTHKRKFENMLVLEQPKVRLKFIYV